MKLLRLSMAQRLGAGLEPTTAALATSLARALGSTG